MGFVTSIPLMDQIAMLTFIKITDSVKPEIKKQILCLHEIVQTSSFQCKTIPINLSDDMVLSYKIDTVMHMLHVMLIFSTR